jgi:hypothetical protein
VLTGAGGALFTPPSENWFRPHLNAARPQTPGSPRLQGNKFGVQIATRLSVQFTGQAVQMPEPEGCARRGWVMAEQSEASWSEIHQ